VSHHKKKDDAFPRRYQSNDNKIWKILQHRIIVAEITRIGTLRFTARARIQTQLRIQSGSVKAWQQGRGSDDLAFAKDEMGSSKPSAASISRYKPSPLRGIRS
jgi:hypothetical protein